MTTAFYNIVLALTPRPHLSIQSILSIAENVWFEVLLQPPPSSSHHQALPTNLASYILLKSLENLVRFYIAKLDCCLYSLLLLLPCCDPRLEPELLPHVIAAMTEDGSVFNVSIHSWNQPSSLHIVQRRPLPSQYGVVMKVTDLGTE